MAENEQPADEQAKKDREAKRAAIRDKFQQMMAARKGKPETEEEKKAREGLNAKFWEKAQVRMEAFKNRVIPDELTMELLQSTPDEQLSQLVMDYVCQKTKNVKAPEWPAIVGRLSPEVQAIYVSLCVEGEVNNGGFHQFFFNSSGQFANIAAECFERMGAPKHADIMRRAVAQFRNEQPMQAKIREPRSLETFFNSYKETQLGTLDKEFYALKRNGYKLEPLRIQYIRSHVRAFVTK